MENTPLDKLCKRCSEQLQWRLDYRKYKPLDKAKKCHKCTKPFVLKAYRTICDICAVKDKKDGVLLCTKCCHNVKIMDQFGIVGSEKYGKGQYARVDRPTKKDDAKLEKEIAEVEEALSEYKLRARRHVERKIQNGEVRFSHTKKVFVYTGDEDREFQIDNKDDAEYGVEEHDSMEDEESDGEEEEKKSDGLTD